METQLGFVALQVRDLEVAGAFYTQVIGFRRTADAPPGAIVFMSEQGAAFAVRVPLPGTDAEKEFGVGVGLWFAVQDAGAAHDRMLAAGALVLTGPQPGPFGRMFTVRDPDGYLLTFHQG